VRAAVCLALLVATALAAGAGAAPAAAAPCGALRPGPSDGPYYRTVAPFEHDNSARTQVFPATCPVTSAHVSARQAQTDFTTPYFAVTRNRDQLYVYGYGADAATQGGYVAGVDPRTLRQRWRTQIPDPSPPGQWSYPGVMLAHGNGFLYAVYGNILVKLDPDTGAVVHRRVLPEDPGGTGAAYNGMVVLPDGNLALKKIERGPCTSTASPLSGLQCALANQLPSLLVIVEPDRLHVTAEQDLGQTVLGRITYGGGDIYIAGQSTLSRYRYAHGRVRLDRSWGPVTYRTGAQTPGTGTGLLGDWVVVQTNFLPSGAPLTVTAVSTKDDHTVFRTEPFPGQSMSWIVSKAALDVANRTVVTHDTDAGQMAALRLDPRHGFRTRWRRPLSSLDFSALIGDPAHRQIVIADRRDTGESVVWLDERNGREVARSPTLSDVPAPGNIVTPGFDRRFFYVSARGALWELRAR
jgi:DNA-binding beta-propeller fold protein YncE